jgi:hypothetical protein
MQVVAVSTPSSPAWRWRIVKYSGEVLEESRETFPSIAAAVACGNRELLQLNIVDRTVRPAPYRSTSHLRSR